MSQRGNLVLLLAAVAACSGGDGDDSTATDAAMPADAPSGAVDAPATDAPTPDATPVDAGPSGVLVASYDLSPGYFDVALDAERHRVFLSMGSDGTVEAVSLLDGTVDTITTGQTARHLHVDPAIDRVLVSLISGADGYVAPIDATTLSDPLAWPLPWAPGDLTSDGSGRAYVISSDGDLAVTLDVATGDRTLSGEPFSTRFVEMHPDLDHFYGSTGSRLQRFQVVAGTISLLYEAIDPIPETGCSRFHLDYSGNLIYAQCGYFFHATDTFGTDMSEAGHIGPPWLDLAFEPGGNRIFTVASGATEGLMNVYDSATHMPLPAVTLSAPAQRLLAGPDYLVLIMDIGDPPTATRLEVLPMSEL